MGRHLDVDTIAQRIPGSFAPPRDCDW